MRSSTIDEAAETIREAMATQDGLERTRLIQKAVAIHLAGLEEDEAAPAESGEPRSSESQGSEARAHARLPT